MVYHGTSTRSSAQPPRDILAHTVPEPLFFMNAHHPSNQIILTVWGHNNKSTVCWGFLSSFEPVSEVLRGTESSELMGQSYVSLQGGKLVLIIAS